MKAILLEKNKEIDLLQQKITELECLVESYTNLITVI
jgi:hypothetical protein